MKLWELLLGIEGLALLRGVITGSDEEAAARVADMGRILDDAPSLSAATSFPERSVEEGYATWSTTYDRRDNPLIALEETVLLPLVRGLLAGRALDAACGTGRVSAHLAAAGHDVVGVDLTPEMLELARARSPARVTASHFRAHCLALLDEAAAGEEITKHGRPVARVGPAEPPGDLTTSVTYHVDQNALIEPLVVEWDAVG